MNKLGFGEREGQSPASDGNESEQTSLVTQRPSCPKCQICHPSENELRTLKEHYMALIKHAEELHAEIESLKTVCHLHIEQRQVDADEIKRLRAELDKVKNELDAWRMG